LPAALRPGNEVENLGVAGEAIDREDSLADELRAANEQVILAALRAQKLAERAHHEAAQQTALIEQLQAGVVLLDPAMGIHVMNQSARELFGVCATRGARLDELGVAFQSIRGAELTLSETPFQQMFNGQPFSDREIVLVRAGGSRRRVSVGGSLVRDRSGEIASAVAVLHDVTELRELEKMREEYIALLSHDLRSPLSGVSLFSSLLEQVLAAKGLVTEAGNARRIFKSAQELAALVQDLLESTRLEAGNLALHRTKVDFHALISDVCENLSPSQPGRLQISCDESLLFSADEPRINRAITNLVSNALKYSASESPVRVTCHRTDDDLTISVQDAGLGIAPQHRPHIFEKYYRAGGNQRTEGIGLGLYIVRMIVESHGGRIWVDTELGRGSTFSFRLPAPA
jgi:NtrC-family two-component system sensor histidine kinase KinB